MVGLCGRRRVQTYLSVLPVRFAVKKPLTASRSLDGMAAAIMVRMGVEVEVVVSRVARVKAGVDIGIGAVTDMLTVLRRRTHFAKSLII